MMYCLWMTDIKQKLRKLVTSVKANHEHELVSSQQCSIFQLNWLPNICFYRRAKSQKSFKSNYCLHYSKLLCIVTLFVSFSSLSFPLGQLSWSNTKLYIILLVNLCLQTSISFYCYYNTIDVRYVYGRKPVKGWKLIDLWHIIDVIFTCNIVYCFVMGPWLGFGWTA